MVLGVEVILRHQSSLLRLGGVAQRPSHDGLSPCPHQHVTLLQHILTPVSMSAVNIYQILHVRRSLGSLVLCNQLSPSTEVTLVIYRAGPHCQQGSADLLNDTKKKEKNRISTLKTKQKWMMDEKA
uniref:Uncharacterized protein n=1 Tax=Astatotilapia calliptera TaxID=8154 RepID=A0AAX7TRX9_ASTCA